MRNAKIIMLTVILSCPALFGWERFYGGDSLDIGYCVIQDNAGNFVISGTTYSISTDNFDAYLIKADNRGDTIWTRTFGGSNYDDATGLTQASDNGYVIVGSSNSFTGDETFDVYIVKTDTAGATDWVKTYGSSEDDFGSAIIRTSDNGFAITGVYNYYPDYDLGYYVGDVYVIKTDAGGDTSWTRHYGGSDDDAGSFIAQTHDGGYVITGYTYSLGPGIVDTSNIYLAKLNRFGGLDWQRGIDYNHSFDDAYFVYQLGDNGFIIAGGCYTTARKWDALLVKTDSLGNPQWQRTYGDNNSDIAYTACKTRDNGYILAGQTASFGANWVDIYLVKTDSLGNMLWQNKYGGNGIDRALSVLQTSDGGYIVVGLFGGDTAQSVGDVYLLKVDSAGTPMAVLDPSTQSPSNFFLDIFPNPFNSALNISAPPGTHIEIFNLLGQKIDEFGDKNIWQPNLPSTSGVYFLRATNRNNVLTKRAVYIK